MLNSDPAYDLAPRIVIWEMTRACALACLHCRAEAIPFRDPRELTTSEAFALMDDIAACGNPLLVLTGGDPLMRDDVYKVIEYGTSLGLHVSISPSATGRLTSEAIRRLAVAGIRRMSLSLDAPEAAAHDAFRGVKGSFARTLDAVHAARKCGIEVQINTTLSTRNHERIEEFAALIAPLEIVLWSVFFVLPVGRATDDLCLDAQQSEAAFARLAAVAATSTFGVKTTEAPAYRRYLMQHRDAVPPGRSTRLPGQPARYSGIGDGRGFVFVSHHGDIQPSGFLPVTVGNVRMRSLREVYCNEPVMQRLRRPETFEGKCGVCEFRRVCGGSRARAYAATGNPFASDPACGYVPTAALGTTEAS